MRILLSLIPVMLVLFLGCSFPKIIVLHDPLTAEEHESLGKVYETKGEQDLALEQYRGAVSRDPKRASSYLLLGDLAFKLRKFDDAEKAYEKASQLQPDNGDIDNNLCWIYLEQRTELKKSLRRIDHALEKTPEHRAYYLDTKGVILFRMGDREASIRLFQEALSLLSESEQPYREEVQRHLDEATRVDGVFPVHR